MTMHMAAVNVCCDDRLSVLSEIFSDECFGYLVGEFRRYVLRVCEAHYIMDSFHRAFSLQRFRTAELVPCELLINKPHLSICLFSVRGTVYRSRVEHILGLIRVQNVGYTFFD